MERNRTRTGAELRAILSIDAPTRERMRASAPNA
jgi:hypothetical protein